MTGLMNRRDVLAGLAGTTVLAGVPFAHAQDNAVRIGTSSVGSVYYVLAVGIGEMIRDIGGINTAVESVGGSSANINALNRDEIDLALVNGFAAWSANNGSFGFRAAVDLRLVLQGQVTTRGLITRVDAGISDPADLEGKTIVGERRALPEIRLILDTMIEHFGLDAGSINIVATTNSNEAYDALAAGSVDAVLAPYSPASAAVERLFAAGLVEPFHLSAPDRDAMIETLPAPIFAGTIPTNAMSGLSRPIELFAMNTYLVARPDLSEETVHTISGTIFDNVDTLASYVSVGRFYTSERVTVSPGLPLHAGTVRYLKEADLWTPEMEAVQSELLHP